MSTFKISDMKKLLFLFIICLVSCSKDLDKLPLTAPSSASFPTNAAELQTALVGCNSPLNLRPGGSENPFILWFEMYSDIAANRDVSPEQSWGDPGGGNVDEIWNNMYTGIARCNFLLDNLNKAAGSVSDSVLANYGAQAKFLRAYYYFLLSSFYGDVPYITRTLSLSEANVSRTPKPAVVDSIISELELASQNLTVSNQPNTMTITRGAAWALESRVALYAGKWQTAIDAAQKVMAMEGSQYVLNPNYGDICMLAGKTSKEIIWAIQWNYNNIFNLTPQVFRSRNASGYSNRIPVQPLVDSYECIDGLTIDKSPLYDPAKPFEKRDPRLGLTIALPGSVFYGYQFETNKDSLTCWNYNVNPAIRIPNLDATATYASFSGYCWRKYADPKETDATKSNINTIVMRYAEVLLNFAEAKIESNQLDQSVYDAINKIRDRAGMPEITSGKSQEELRSVLRMERKVEFAGEGLRYYDIIRWGIAEQVLNGPCYGRIPRGLLSSAPVIDGNGTPDYSTVSNSGDMRVIQNRTFNKTKNYLWPIPAIELQTNKNLTQNPGF